MIRQTNLAHAIDVAADRARYDECAKKILTFQAVIAWILKYCTKEFSGYSVSFICDNCLREDAEISERAVHQDNMDWGGCLDGDWRLNGMNTEANAMKDQTVYYDIRFRAFLPGNREPVRLIINLEIQLDDVPGYPIVKRGFYYCARMISEQYGTVFTKEQYGKLEKVYSIWICPNPAKKRKNGIFRYYTVEESVHGTSYTETVDYDMMEVVVLNLGDEKDGGEQKLLKLLNVLFSTTATPEEKKRTLQEEYNIAMTEEFESEVRTMCNLSKGLIEQGIEQGIEQKNMLLAQLMLKDREPMDKIQKYTGYTAEKLAEIAKAMGKQNRA